jgi:hypothetical protein
MARAGMAARCPGARFVGAAVLDHHRFAIVRGGHGTVRPRTGARVHGVLWRLGRGDEAALDRYEEIATGLYRRATRLVRIAGRAVLARIYIAAARGAGRPRAAYLGAIIQAAREFGFPADYLAALAAIARTSSGVRPDSRSARRVSDRSRLA